MEPSEYIVEKAEKMGTNDVVCTIVNQKTRQIIFANDVVQTVKSIDLRVANVFLAVNKRLISTTIHDMDRISIDREIEKAVKTAKLLAPKEDYYGIAKGPFKYKDVPDTFDKRIVDLREKDVGLINDSINAASSNGAKRSSGTFYSNVWDVAKLTSNGVEGREKGTNVTFSIRSFAEKDASGHNVCVSRSLSGFEPTKIATEAAELARDSLKPEQGNEGKFDILFHPMVFANLLYYMAYGFSAFEVDSGTSFLINKLGKKVGSDSVTLLDDPRMPNGFGSRSFDEEGMPTKTINLIEGGHLKTFVHNTSTAKKFKTQSTGHAGLVYPFPWNIVLKNGNHSFEEMVQQVKNGLYITNVWYTRFTNYRTGDFSTIPRDAMFEIKNGRIGRSVKGLRLSDNMQRILENVVAISKNAQTIYWWEVMTPVTTGFVLCKDLNLTKSTK